MAATDQIVFILTLLAALGCGLVAGVFFAFSTFVMKALARIAPDAGIAAMQSINVVVLNPWFMSAFLGTAANCIVLLILSLLRWHEPGASCLLAGAVFYLVGTLLVTIVFNVPRERSPGRDHSDRPRRRAAVGPLVAEWTTWNRVRTIAALAAAAAFSIALAY